jgi:ubiquinone biosynthesis protein
MRAAPSLLHTVRDLGRLREIAAVLARHGFGQLVERTGLGTLAPWKSDKNGAEAKTSTAERMRRVLEELGPSFIKLGQIISTRPDLVPADIIEEFRRLQDDVQPTPFDQMRAVIEQQLGAATSELFTELDETPIASASIGQVYRAKLRTDQGDEEVVVKVQRPNIASTIERDIDLLYWFAHAIERSVPEASVYSPVKLVGEFDRAISAELDYTQEADNAERFRENFADLPTVMFPRVYRQASSRKVITLSYIPGEKVLDAVAHGASGERIAKNAVQVTVRMIFEHGFFHADPHPGNILITGDPAEPVLGLIDLGLVGRLSPKLRDRLIDLVVAIGREDHRAMTAALYAIGRPTKRIDRAAFEAEVMRLSDKYLHKRLEDVEFADLIRDLAGGAIRYGIEIPPDFMLVGKSLMTVEGIARQIYPQLNVAAEVRPHVTDIVGARYSPERITSDLLHLASRLGSTASELPGLADDILDDLRHGRLTLEVRQASLLHAQERLGRRIFMGLILGASVVGAAILLAAHEVFLGGALLAGAALWGVLNGAAMVLGKNRPPD